VSHEQKAGDMPVNDKTADRVNDLISTCMDSNEGFLKAAKGVHDDELRATLTRIANRRSEMADELRSAQQPGARTAELGHGGGVLRRGWVDLEQRIRHGTGWRPAAGRRTRDRRTPCGRDRTHARRVTADRGARQDRHAGLKVRTGRSRSQARSATFCTPAMRAQFAQQ
jgi:hypothetical protein